MDRRRTALASLAVAGTILLSGCGDSVERLDEAFNEWNWHGCTPEERSEFERSGETPPMDDDCYGEVNAPMTYDQWLESKEIEQKQNARRLKASPRSAEGVYERCQYMPTMNYDWHDDMVCDGRRLYLREWDDHVTESELWESAAKWINR